MIFEDFARLHGVLIDRLQVDSKWHRVPTDDHPRKKNGAYRHAGAWGHVQNHSTMTEPALWEPDSDEVAKIDHAAIAARARQAALQIHQGQATAAKRAGWILSQCELETHPYLTAKGFQEERGNVWVDEKAGDRKLCIPMRIDGHVVGLQTISDRDGFDKRFLFGQRTSDASFVIEAKGPKYYCEGYATALSARLALKALCQRYTVFVCFSAANLSRLAKNHGTGLVIADNDKSGTGQRVAIESGLPYWISDLEGEDFNDFWRRVGTFAASQSLRAVLMQ